MLAVLLIAWLLILAYFVPEILSELVHDLIHRD